MKGFNLYEFRATDSNGNEFSVIGEANNPYYAFLDAKRKNPRLKVIGGGRLVKRSY